MLQDTTNGITDLEIAMVGCEFRILFFFVCVGNNLICGRPATALANYDVSSCQPLINL